MRPAIRVENLGKKYQLGVTHARSLNEAASRWTRRLCGLPPAEVAVGTDDRAAKRGEFWALNDVSFDVQPGEVVGIIGRNGAGKSTLLKILSRVARPTTGRVEINGRVGSLLEVGTGFHPELTGRENVHLNGMLLGMTKREVVDRFDAIIDFAGVEKFIDTPVKRYSSGMKVRLGFAVAAHLEPEVLIVDEVLAVGDAEFQRKCIGKMGEVAGDGRSVIFVSHSMGAVQQLCPRAIVMRSGGRAFDGPVRDAVLEHLGGRGNGGRAAFALDEPSRSGCGTVRLTGGRLISEGRQDVGEVVAGMPLAFEFEYRARGVVPRMDVFVTIYNHLGVAATHLATPLHSDRISGPFARGSFRCDIDRNPLPVGRYRTSVAVNVDGKLVDHIPRAMEFEVTASVFFGSSRSPDIAHCAVMADHRWRHQPEACVGGG